MKKPKSFGHTGICGKQKAWPAEDLWTLNVLFVLLLCIIINFAVKTALSILDTKTSSVFSFFLLHSGCIQLKQLILSSLSCYPITIKKGWDVWNHHYREGYNYKGLSWSILERHRCACGYPSILTVRKAWVWSSDWAWNLQVPVSFPHVRVGYFSQSESMHVNWWDWIESHHLGVSVSVDSYLSLCGSVMDLSMPFPVSRPMTAEVATNTTATLIWIKR